MNGIARLPLRAMLMQRDKIVSKTNMDYNGATPYCIYALRTYCMEQFKAPEWKANALLKVGKAGSITQRMRQYEQPGIKTMCEWLIWTSKQSAKDVEKHIHSLLIPYSFKDSQTVATETHTINTDHSLYFANMLKNEICNRKDVLGMDIFNHDNTQEYKFREQTQHASVLNHFFEEAVV